MKIIVYSISIINDSRFLFLFYLFLVYFVVLSMTLREIVTRVSENIFIYFTSFKKLTYLFFSFSVLTMQGEEKRTIRL